MPPRTARKRHEQATEFKSDEENIVLSHNEKSDGDTDNSSDDHDEPEASDGVTDNSSDDCDVPEESDGDTGNSSEDDDEREASNGGTDNSSDGDDEREALNTTIQNLMKKMEQERKLRLAAEGRADAAEGRVDSLEAKLKEAKIDRLETRAEPLSESATTELKFYQGLGNEVHRQNPKTLRRLKGYLDQVPATSSHILFDGSSGLGKTQVAFALVDRPVLYFVFDSSENMQPIYQPFRTATTLLEDAYTRDVGVVHRRTFNNASSLRRCSVKLWVCAVVRHFLRDEKEVLTQDTGEAITVHEDGKITVGELMQNLEHMNPKPAVVLDEVYATVQVDTSAAVDGILTFFRALNLRPIVTGTNSVVGELADGSGSRESDPSTAEHSDVLLLVHPLRFLPEPLVLAETRRSLPHFTESCVCERWQRLLQLILRQGRPLFTRIIVQEIWRTYQRTRSALSESHMGDVLRQCILRLNIQKKHARTKDAGRLAQLRLFLPMHRTTPQKAIGPNTMIRYHFAKVHGSNIELLHTSSGWVKFTKNPAGRQLWKPSCTFPQIDKEPLLYLLMATALNPDVPVFGLDKEKPRTATSAIRHAMNTSLLERVDLGNPNAASRQGEFLEAVAMTAIGIASTLNPPYVGTPWRDFFARLFCELQMNMPEDLRYEDSDLPVERFLDSQHATIPYMIPSVNKEESKFLDTVWRPKNGEMVDILTSFEWLSGECKFRGEKVAGAMIIQNMERVPANSKVHIVFAHKLARPDQIFANSKKLWEHVSGNDKDNVALVRLVKKDNRSITFDWLVDAFREARQHRHMQYGAPRPEHPTSVVIYIESPMW
eukprot:m.885235 g.885235  ORF g.885235 m.885235 type:complete len:828 (+) comp23617_c0_seq3:94-2577(+)